MIDLPQAPALRVLVIDDDVDAAQSLCYVLEAMGCETAAGNDGPEGLEIAGTFDPELAIIDLDMPGMKGWETMRHLRLQEANSLKMVVCLTGRSGFEDRWAAIHAGFDEFMMKPLFQETLTEVVNRTRASVLRHAMREVAERSEPSLAAP